MATMREMVTMAKPMPRPMGANLQTVSGLDCENWPRAVSIRYMGFPRVNYSVRSSDMILHHKIR